MSGCIGARNVPLGRPNFLLLTESSPQKHHEYFTVNISCWSAVRALLFPAFEYLGGPQGGRSVLNVEMEIPFVGVSACSQEETHNLSYMPKTFPVVPSTATLLTPKGSALPEAPQSSPFDRAAPFTGNLTWFLCTLY